MMCLWVPLFRCRYGAHLSKEQVAQLVAPHPDTLQLINTWLEHHNVPPSSISTSYGGDRLTITDVPVSQANEMLGASYQLYRHTGTNDTAILRTIGYALPAVLHPHVRTVVPTTYFASIRILSQTPRGHTVREFADMSSTKVSVTPAALRSLYGTVAYEPTATDRNILGVAGFRQQFASETDLTAFMAGLRMDALDATFTVIKVNRGMYNPRYPGYEANLNMQYAQAIAYPTPHVFYSIGGTPQVRKSDMEPAPGDLFFEWLSYMIDEPNVPQTISVSYGGLENDVPPEYAKTLCDLFAGVGARGVSVIVPSGNEGVGRGDCKAKDGSGRVQFSPEFPATCMCSVVSLTFEEIHHVAHYIATALQVPSSLPWAARRVCPLTPRLQRASPGAASRTISLARRISAIRCLSSCDPSAASIMACTSGSLPQPDMTYSCLVDFVASLARPAAASPTYLPSHSISLSSSATSPLP